MNKQEEYNVFSGFNGMGCIWLALDRAGIKVNKRYSAEIDKYASQVNDANYSDTIQLGDITKWKEWDIDWKNIHLFVGGSPCQGFSFAGKQLNFEDPRSKLFFVWVDILNHIKKLNPNVKFLLENVNMKKEYLRVISEYLGIFPARFNSNIISAQNRDRWYWSNIKTDSVGLFGELYTHTPVVEDKGILLKDILQPESEIDKKCYISNKQLNRLDLGNLKHTGQISFNGSGIENNKATALLARDYKGISGNQGFNVCCVAMIGRKLDENGVRKDNNPNIKAEQRLEPQTNGKTNCLTSVSKDNLIMTCLTPKRNEYGKEVRKDYEAGNISEKRSNMTDLEPREDGKTNTLSTVQKDNLLTNGYKLRRLTPIECERLQTVPDNFTSCVSDTQRYKMLGNGWTIDAIIPFLEPLKTDNNFKTK